jgi:hypothetical protein
VQQEKEGGAGWSGLSVEDLEIADLNPAVSDVAACFERARLQASGGRPRRQQRATGCGGL